MDDPDVDLHYDTDEVSLASTHDSDNDGSKEYDVKCILSEDVGEDEHGKLVPKYLIEWEGYRKDEYQYQGIAQTWMAQLTTTGTWEPAENLEHTDLIPEWEQMKRTIGPVAYRRLKLNNEADFERARKRHIYGKGARDAKRAKKRAELQKSQRSRPLVPASDSEDDTPLMQLKSINSSKAKKPDQNVPASQSSHYDNFVDSQDSHPLPPPPKFQPSGGESLFVSQQPIARKAPFEQSATEDEEESSDSADSEDSLMGELASSTKSRRHKSKSGTNRVPDLDNSVLSTQSPRRKAALLSEKPAPKQPTTKAGSTQVAQKLTAPVAAMVPSVTQLKNQTIKSSGAAAQITSPASRRKSTGASDVSASAAKEASKRASKLADAARPTGAGLPSKSSGATAIRKTGGSSKSSAPAIKITSEPKTQQRREWEKSNHLFRTLKSRHAANKRRNMEATPELNAEDFPNCRPPGIPSRAADNNLYGRREAGTRRVQETDSYEPFRQSSVEDTVPLAEYEVNKVPLVCPQWRLSSNCPYTAASCNYLHRDKDENGNDLPVGHLSGFIPPKYRKQPLTCLYWLKSEHGCKKPDDECIYAHKNTGWVPQDPGDNRAVRIDPNALPLSALPLSALPIKTGAVKSKDRALRPQDKRRMQPSELTCWYWTQDICKHTADRCIFQHFDTGVVAEPPPSEITCRYWLEGYCRQTADQCKFQHHNTGIVSGKTSAAFGPSTTFPNTGFQQDYAARSPVIDLPTAWTEQLPLQPPPPAPPAPAPKPPATYSCAEMRDKLEQVLKINFVDLFEWDRIEGATVMLDRRAMLLFHPVDHAEELELITRWLLLHHVDVSSAWHEGCWDSLRQHVSDGGSAVIIAHPDFEYFTELKGFGRLLRNRLRLFALGVQEGIEFDPALSSAPQMRHDCVEIFPVGGFIYVTEDVFEKKPQLALQIVKQFFAKIDKLRQLDGPVSPWQEVDDAPLLWRLCVRPEFMEYLFARCEEQQNEIDAGDPDAMARATLYSLLSETNYIEQDNPVLPFSAISDKYPIMSERRIVGEDQPLDYFAVAARNPDEATRRMIRYYAGLQVDMRRDYRHFYVVHTEPFAPCVQTWKQDSQTVAEVIDPERCVAELSKSDVRGDEMPLIDFHERHMPLKLASTADAMVD